MAAIAGDIFNTQFVSGPQPGSGRNMGRLSNFSRLGVAGEPGLRFEMVVLGWVGLGIGCPGEPAVFDTTETFTNSDVCLYGGYTYDHDQLNAWHQVDSDGDGTIDNAAWGVGTAPNFTVGGFVVTDGRAPWGVAGVDDDGNGTTDGDVSGTDSMLEHDYKGADGGWGVAGFDDNGINGIDDQGERGWPGSDDTDDQMGRHSQQIMMELRHSNKTC